MNARNKTKTKKIKNKIKKSSSVLRGYPNHIQIEEIPLNIWELL